MSWINRDLIVQCLRELSDEEFQRRVWLSSGGEMVSSFSEVVEQLFTDSGLEGELEGRSTGLGAEVEETLMSLEKQLSRVNRNQLAAMLIEDPAMGSVRALAKKALGQLRAS